MLLHSSSLRSFLVGSVSSLALAFWAHTAAANPIDGVVETGSAEISAPTPGTLVINQTSDKAIINWCGFDVGLGEQTRFVLPGRTSVTLNRDFSGDPSEILGSVTSNGRFYLINPNGVLFGRNARVDVAGLVATTNDIRSSDFLADRLDFSMAGEPGASVINQGQIRVDDLGFGAFVAPHVRNDGIIVARMGKVELASASGFTLDLRGDSLISFLVENPNQYGILDANGQPVSALVENSGTITADGGQVVLRAAAARGVVDSVINSDGIIQANTVEKRGGKIVLGGGGAGTVKVAGKVTARGEKEGEKGGEIIVTGTLLTADQTAIIDASGWAGGGKLLIGGDYLGGKATNEDIARFHFTMEDEPIASATAAFLMDGSQLKADALMDGDGGKVVVWSEEATVSAADISAKGGSQSGDGGFIETSGGYLQVEKVADATAANGAAGTWLLDPLDITIDRTSNSNSLWWRNPDEAFSLYTGGSFNADAFRPTGTGSVLSASLIESALNAGNNVVVTTFGTIGSGTGDIRLGTDITKTMGGSARLSLLAADDVTIDPGVDVRSFAGGLEFEVSAQSGSIVGSGIGQIALNGGRMLLVARDDVRFSSAFDMPDNLSVLLNNLGNSTSLKGVDVAFGQDRLRFDFSSRVVELYAGAISLLDTTATGTLFIGFAQGVNAHLYDRAIVSNADRIWGLAPTVSASVPNANALNGFPEIEGFTDPFWTFGAEPGAGYTPVIEVSVLRDGTTDAGRNIVTATSGYAALSAYLTRPRPVSPIQQVIQQATDLNVNLQATNVVMRPALSLSCQLALVQCQLLQQGPSGRASGLTKEREDEILAFLEEIMIAGDYADVLVEGRLSELSSKAGVSYWELFGVLLDATEALDQLEKGNYVDGVAGLSVLASTQLIKRTPAGGAVFGAYGTASLFALPVEASLKFLVRSLNQIDVKKQQEAYDLLRKNGYSHSQIMKQEILIEKGVVFTTNGFISADFSSNSGNFRAGFTSTLREPNADRDALFTSFDVAYKIKNGSYATELGRLKREVMADFAKQAAP